MRFAQSAGAAGQDLYTDYRKLCGIGTSDTTTSPIDPDFTLAANAAVNQVESFIFLYDKLWNWDDSNHTDLPTATTTLVDGQADYSLAVTHLKILEVKVMDSAGTYQTLTKLQGEEIDDYRNRYTTSGMPQYYGVRGNSVFLVPAPSTSNVTAALGLKIAFQRGADLFTVSDTTQEPGWASPFHRLVSLYAAREYNAINGKPSLKANCDDLILQLEAKFKNFLETRSGEEQPRMRLRRQRYDAGAYRSHPKRFYF